MFLYIHLYIKVKALFVVYIYDIRELSLRLAYLTVETDSLLYENAYK